ncbi:hypothetical protein ACFL1I_04735 [Candidatus Omnitrophota bacterium]
MSRYRPWGKLAWLLPKVERTSWNLVGCLGTEDRSLEVYRRLKKDLLTAKLLKILDEDFEYSVETKKIIEGRVSEVARLAGNGISDIVEDHRLLETHYEILSPLESYISDKRDVVLDVSSLPKRFFFPMLKTLIRSPHIQNLIVTYTVPKAYTQCKLSRNLMPWAHLPLFSGGEDSAGKETKALVIAVGFDPMGIPQELSLDGHGVPIELLFPFPAPLSSVRRSWEFVQNIEKGRRQERGINLHRVEAKNPSDAFDRLCALLDPGREKIELAPFGPKPVSVAMCIFATLTESEVFYTQPKSYALDYSSGISEVFAYAVKLDGRSFYSL